MWPAATTAACGTEGIQPGCQCLYDAFCDATQFVAGAAAALLVAILVSALLARRRIQKLLLVDFECFCPPQRSACLRNFVRK